MKARILIPIAHLELRRGDEYEVLGHTELVERGKQRHVVLVDVGGQRLGLWPHECALFQPEFEQARLEV